ncbi:MAG: hypothetical protein HYZ63_00070 [Candidatus Andersenbacteria bacterium]|nr:hypothetical protein [Candidatus Andersenbacteria bacterium]
MTIESRIQEIAHTMLTAIKVNWIGLALAGGLWLFFFLPIITGQALYFLDDLKIIYYPLEQEYAAFQHAWQLPQWSHYFGFGLSGFFIVHLNHVNFYTTTMVLPFLLIAADALIAKPTFTRAGAVAAAAACMALSGQPQVILYSFIIALIILVPRLLAAIARQAGKKKWILLSKVIGFTIIAAGISLGIASINLLPLREFLPQTERNASLPPEEYFEFSYPPSHAITLVMPYYFGNHKSYWGAKGFQELAAFVGLAPLFLAGVALTLWNHNRSARISAVILAVITFFMATGKYSPLYVWLVESHLLPPLAVPGRFVFFFNVSLALLAAIGFDDSLRLRELSRKQRLLAVTAPLIFIAMLLAPFFVGMAQDERWYFAFTQLGSINSSQLIPLIIGIACIPVVLSLKRFSNSFHSDKPLAIIIGLTVILPLLLYAWDYNPRLPRPVALAQNIFANDLLTAGKATPVPPRLFSHERLLQSTAPNELTRRTDLISPAFSVIQPIFSTTKDWQCIVLQTFAKDTREGTLVVTIYKDLATSAIRRVSVLTQTLNSSGGSPICFEGIHESQGQQFFVHITSPAPTGIQLLYEKNDNPDTQAYFIRTKNPTPEELARSRKSARLNIEPSYVLLIDRETAMLARHLQVIAGSSSARWIGALSIRPYREFIEKFFANDGEVIDGDGMHAIERNRLILDMSGVTHLIQSLPTGSTDTMANSGFTVVDDYHTGEKNIRLYANPNAWPKAFLVPNAEFRAAPDETRFAMIQPDFNPKDLVILSGDLPPKNAPVKNSLAATDTATVKTYTPTRVDIAVNTQKNTYLVVTDSHTQEWQTFIDGQQAPHLVAYSVFKAAEVPAGEHIVSFQYISPATTLAKKLAIGGLVALLAILLLPPIISKAWHPLPR